MPLGRLKPPAPPLTPIVSVNASNRIVAKGEKAPGNTIGGGLPAQAVRYTRAEVAEQMRVVESLVVQCASRSSMISICRQQLNIGPSRINKLVLMVLDAWKEEDAEMKAANKPAAIRRLYRNILNAQGQQDAQGNWIRKPDHPSLARYEALLADIQGTREPIKVDIDVRVSTACVNVIANMSSADVQKYLVMYKENCALADQMRQQQSKRLGHPDVSLTP